ncbi:endonuclease domain-containing protein [Nocardia niigatensis]
MRLLCNHPIGPYRCDFVDERSRTVIEIDGREFHSGSIAFRHDRRRQNELLLDGWLVLRYAAADVYESVDKCVDEVAAVIRRRRR